MDHPSEVIAVFIPIIAFLVIGLITVTYFYYRSRERQMLIEKGLSAEDIKKFFEQKKDQFRLMKVGIICVTFGLGLGFGLMLQDYTNRDYWVPFSLFVLTGLGFVIANVVTLKLEKQK